MSDNKEKRVEEHFYFKLNNSDRVNAILEHLVADLTDEEKDAFFNKEINFTATYDFGSLSENYNRMKSNMVAEEVAKYKIDPDNKNPLSFIAEAVGNYDFDNEVRETINGNEFVFNDSFPIDQYRDELNDLGNEEQGNRWYVQLNDDGKLVVY